MKNILICLMVLLSVMTVLPAADVQPGFAEIKKMLRKDHPRLFITRDRLPQFRGPICSRRRGLTATP